MYKLGLLGQGISYTLSPLVHGAIFDYLGVEGTYDVFDTPPESFSDTVKKMRETLDGFNVTKPYKEKLIPLLDEDKSGCGAVNTVAVKDGKAVGCNTDGRSLQRLLRIRALRCTCTIGRRRNRSLLFAKRARANGAAERLRL